MSIRAALLLPVSLAAALATGASATAAPLLNPNNGGLAFAGPTETHVLAIWYNPAALVDPALDDSKIVVYLGGNLLLRQAEISRFAIDPGTGQAAGGALMPAARLDAKQPDGFFGFYLRVSEKVVFGLAVHTPYREYGGTEGAETPAVEDDSPVRFHRLHTWWYDFWVHPATSIKVGKNFSIGLGLPFSYTNIRELSFDRDSAVDCPPPGMVGAGACADSTAYELPLRTQRLRINGSNWNLAAQFGLLARIKGKFHLGFSFITSQFWFDRADVRLDGDGQTPNATLTQAGKPDVPGFARIRYDSPWIFQLGLRWLLSSKAELVWNVRAASFNQQDRLELRLSSDGFRTAGLPERIYRYRGMRWGVRTDLRGNYHLTDNVRVAGGAGFELSPVPSKFTSAETMDGETVFVNARGEWHPAKGFFFSGGYELGIMLPRTVNDSGFSPLAGSQCAAAGRDLDLAVEETQPCAITFAGNAYSTAAGKYTQLTHTVSLGVGFDWTW
jgi:long-subunit fatty acid transport protein